jgi:hypothetical protein
MSIQQLFKAIGVAYEPTNAYSFEFRTSKGGFITEVFMLLPPESYEVTEPTRSTLTKTIGGGYLKDFGNDFKEINIRGSSHFFYLGSPSNKGESFTRRDDFINGYEEFMKLRFLISRYRDYTLTPGGNLGRLVVPTIFGSNNSLFPVLALANKVRTNLIQNKNATYDEIELIWHNYDDDDHFKVRVANFQSSRSKEDPFSVNFNIVLEAYEIDANRSGFSNVPVSRRKKSSVKEQARKIYLYSGTLSTETAPDVLPVQTINGLNTVTAIPPGGN